VSRKRDLSPDEAALWRRVARTVTPHPGRKLPETPAPHPAPAAKGASRKQAEPAPNHPAPLTPGRPRLPADASGEKRVRRGKLEIEASIDLHGMTQDQARGALLDFVTRSRQAGKRVVLVITGKGKGGDGVIRRRFPDWLGEPVMSAQVSAYAPAHQRHGGAGAFYVRLRRGD